MTDRLLNPKQAAEFLGVKAQTLAVWRSVKRYDLPTVRVGRCVRYRPEALEAWLNVCFRQAGKKFEFTQECWFSGV